MTKDPGRVALGLLPLWDVETGCGEVEPFEAETRADGAAHERPPVQSVRGLPMMFWHNQLRLLSGSDVRAKQITPAWTCVGGCLGQLQWRTCVPVPDFGGVYAVPMAAFAGL